MSLKLKGIDVSSWQGTIDWAKVKQSGIQFAILRAGWGYNSIDPQFIRNVQECTKNGIPFGAYWFIYCTDDAGARKNANGFLEAIKDVKLTYPIFADFEYDSVSYANKYGVNVTKDNASRWVKIFLDTLKGAGYIVGNYTNLDFLNRYFDDRIKKGGYEFWYACWGSATTTSNNANVWQYTSKGSVPGISGNVDMNEGHKEYSGNTPVPKPDDDFYGIPKIYKLVFDPDWYYNRYPDLQQAIRDQQKKGLLTTKHDIVWWLYEHFLKYGMDEADYGRFGCASFNVIKYKNAYADLRKAFGNSSYKPYYQHYMQYGALEIKQGRRPKVDLSVD